MQAAMDSATPVRRSRRRYGRYGCVRAATRSCAALVCTALVCVAVTTAGRVSAQTNATGLPAEGLPVELQEIPGLRADMETEELLDSAMGAVMADRLEDGRRILLHVVRREPEHLRALNDLGFIYERLAEEARTELIDPGRAEHFVDQAVDTYSEAAALAVEAEEFGVAEQLYYRILMHRPGRASALRGLASVLAQTGRRLQAIGRYQDYLQTLEGRKDPIGYLELGRLYLAGDFWRQALETLERAAAMDDRNPEIDAAMAEAYLKGERHEEALRAARRATQKAPRQARYRDILAELELSRGDVEQAVIEARRAIDYTREQLADTPRDVRQLEALSRYYGTYERALRTILAEGKANPAVRVDLARAFQEHAAIQRSLSLTRALHVLMGAQSIEREDPRLLEELASIQLALSMEAEATASCRRLLAIEPANTTAQKILEQLEAGRPGSRELRE
jgi:tetratricopeptide (TPR) repeat protein